jgi:arylsulfatase A-like enzyme
MTLRYLLLGFSIMLCTCARAQDRPNVLFIAVDDLRPEINAFGADHVITPNLDSLAAAGMQYDRAYCNVPVCGASRSSILSGVRPTYHRFRRYYSQVDVEVPGLTTLPEMFRRGGYTTVGIGKVFHAAGDRAEAAWTDGGPYVYGSDRLPYPEHSAGGWMNYVGRASKDTLARTGDRALPWEIVDTTDEAYFDGQYARLASERLRDFADSGEPFFLAVGFVKPHLPFTAPRKYWELYDREEIELPDSRLPADAPAALRNFNWGELRNYHGIPRRGPVSDSVARTLIHGYYASVSFVDAQIGKVLRELRETGLDENTLIVLWGDHGYNLGEHGFWAKHITMETALRTTLLVAGPGVDTGATDRIVELVDLYPTLLEYCGLPEPEHELAGESLLGRASRQPSSAPGSRQTSGAERQTRLTIPGAARLSSNYALSKYNNGVTLIGPRYFYTEYHDGDGTITDRMLYDHREDPQEMVNLANRAEYGDLVDQLHDELHARLPEDYWTVEAVAYPGRGD